MRCARRARPDLVTGGWRLFCLDASFVVRLLGAMKKKGVHRFISLFTFLLLLLYSQKREEEQRNNSCSRHWLLLRMRGYV